MNKIQTKDFRMFGTTNDCMDEYSAKWEHILAIVQLKNRLQQNILALKELDLKKTSTVSNPVTLNKEQMKDLLADEIEILAGIATSYAEANDLTELKQKVKLYTKGLAKKREMEIEPNASSFLTMLRELQPQLEDYALTEEMIAKAETLRDQFAALVGAPRTVIVQGSSANNQMDVLIAETLRFLNKQLDNLMLRFKGSSPEFYNAYLQARIIVEPASQSRNKTDDESPAT